PSQGPHRALGLDPFRSVSVLARANRLVRADDYRSAVRRGRRLSTANAMIYTLAQQSEDLRFGFIVSKAVGNAVVRNRVRRRLKAIAHELVTTERATTGFDIVVRAHEPSALATWADLRSDILGLVSRSPAGVSRE